MDPQVLEFFRAIGIAFLSCFPPAVVFFLILLKLIKMDEAQSNVDCSNVVYFDDYKKRQIKTRKLLKQSYL